MLRQRQQRQRHRRIGIVAAADSVALAVTGTGKDPAHGGANPMIATRMMTKHLSLSARYRSLQRGDEVVIGRGRELGEKEFGQQRAV